jgi:hypothetical protein
MAVNPLKKITTRAKHIRRIHGGTWKAAVKKAGAEYRSGKIHGTKKRTPKKTPKKTARRKRIGGTLSASGSSGIQGVRSTFAAAAIGGLTTAQHIAHAKKKIVNDIAAAEARKFQAKTKTAKRKISKKIAEAKARFRKLC